tara:strand:+ start:5499 stop:5897 length:399 start_codon:yes stop_codon:yes gene_type:complete
MELEINNNVYENIEYDNNININKNINNNTDNNSDVNFNDNINYEELDKIRKIIELLNKSHHVEIAKILKKNNIKLTENNNGIFINLNNIANSIIIQIKEYINFIKNQEKLINIDESKKETLENIYFKNSLES